MYVLWTDKKFPDKILATQSQKCLIIIHHDQVGLIPQIQDSFNVWKSAYSIKLLFLKKKNHTIISLEKRILQIPMPNKFQKHLTNSNNQTRKKGQLPQTDREYLQVFTSGRVCKWVRQERKRYKIGKEKENFVHRWHGCL